MREQSAPLDLQDLALFVRVVEARSFSAAARARRLATSAVSRRIARLEERLGARLLERTTRIVVPTEAGAMFYARAARILQEVDEAASETQTLGGAPRGLLRISAPVIFGEWHLAPLLPAFLRRHPDVRVDLSLNDRFVNLIEEHIDVALRIGTLADSSLTRVKVGAVPYCVVASPAYLEKAGVPRVPADLVRHNCIRYSRVSAAHEWRFRGPGGSISSVPVSGNVELNHGGAMLEIALGGVGIVMLPHFLVADVLAAGKLVLLLDEFRHGMAGIHLVYPTSPTRLPKTSVFVEYMAKGLRARLRALNHVTPPGAATTEDTAL